MRFFGVGYRKRKRLIDGRNVDVYGNFDVGSPTFSAQWRDRVTFNPFARRGQKLTVRIAKGWTWRV